MKCTKLIIVCLLGQVLGRQSCGLFVDLGGSLFERRWPSYLYHLWILFWKF